VNIGKQFQCRPEGMNKTIHQLKRIFYTNLKMPVAGFSML